MLLKHNINDTFRFFFSRNLFLEGGFTFQLSGGGNPWGVSALIGGGGGVGVQKNNIGWGGGSLHAPATMRNPAVSKRGTMKLN